MANRADKGSCILGRPFLLCLVNYGLVKGFPKVKLGHLILTSCTHVSKYCSDWLQITCCLANVNFHAFFINRSVFECFSETCSIVVLHITPAQVISFIVLKQ